jgi:T4 RnlA family RNA ligase
MNLQTLEKYYEEGWLIKQHHPNLHLTIWNYSQQTQYEGKWDEITLACRGLVTIDETGEVIARPFKKFFNMEEGKHTPTSEFEVYEKMDGSLGIAFYYQDRWVFASRGSFTSDQAIKGYGMFVNLLNTSRTHFSKGYTYLFEIIYPENRIVVDYVDAERLVLLGKIGTLSGEEYSLNLFRKDPAVDVVREYTIKDYTKLKSLIGDNFEGFVVRFSNGDRMKIKGEEYLRLHKIMTEISTKSVWECLSQGDDLYKILEDVPDEFFAKIDEYAEELTSQYIKIEAQALAHFASISVHTDSRAEFAKYAKLSPLAPVMFKMLDGKDYSEVIWRMIKPEYRKL